MSGEYGSALFMGDMEIIHRNRDIQKHINRT